MTTMTDEQTAMRAEDRHDSGVYARRDLALVAGKGALLWDEAGREYIDCAAGIGVANVGHSHPALVAAIQAQAARLITAPALAYSDVRGAYLAALAERTPAGLDRFFLCNSGAEAVEGAIKFARLASGRSGVVAAARGFHGRTLGALSATHRRQYREPFGPLVPGFRHVPFNDVAALEAAVDADTAALILEPIQGEGGVRPAADGYLQAAREICDARGALLIVDEVQTGFGRTGRWWGGDHAGVIPDLMALGKAIAGGVPMGAVAIGPRVGDLPPGSHGSTFGGNALACAAAHATLQVIAEERLAERADELGHHLRQVLRTINSPLIREVRGRGLMIGVELRVRAKPVVAALQQRGIIALTAGSTVLRLLPPLVVTRRQLDRAAAALADVLAETPLPGRRSARVTP